MISDALLSIFGATNIAPIDPYWSNVDYLVMVNGGSIVDKSSHARTVANVSGVTINGSDMVFNGSSYLYLESDTNLSNHKFTVEGFMQRTSGQSQFMGVWAANGAGKFPSIRWGYDYIYAAYNNSQQVGVSYSISTNKLHWAFQFDPTTNTSTLHIDGVLQLTSTNGVSDTTAATIGLAQLAENYFFNGKMSAVRMTTGMNRYSLSENYTPPTEFPTY